MHLYLQCKITFIDEFDAVLVLEHFSNMSAEQQATQLLILCNTGLQCGCPGRTKLITSWKVFKYQYGCYYCCDCARHAQSK